VAGHSADAGGLPHGADGLAATKWAGLDGDEPTSELDTDRGEME
jgi:hypothetical protein